MRLWNRRTTQEEHVFILGKMSAARPCEDVPFVPSKGNVVFLWLHSQAPFIGLYLPRPLHRLDAAPHDVRGIPVQTLLLHPCPLFPYQVPNDAPDRKIHV